jgi:polysaccharide biosynthesis protein PslH
MTSIATGTASAKTVLLITPYLPYPNVGHAGGKAIYDFMLQLKKRGIKVCLISLAWPNEEKQFEHLRQICDDTDLLVSKPVFTDSFLRSFQANVFLFLPRILRGCLKHLRIRAHLNRAIRDMIGRHKPDIIQVEYSSMAIYLIRIKSAAAKVAHLHDVMIKPYERRWAAESSPLRRVSRWLFFLLVKRCELSFCRGFDEVLVKSEHDKALLLQHGRFRTTVFPLGIAPAAQITGPADREPRSVLFLGAMFREVNEQAARYFAEQVLPILKREVGPVKFYIVGAGPSEQLRRLASPEVVVTGFVEDLSEFYGRCQVLVAPLFIGGGMIFKVVQAMSFGLPVVASTIANEGILARDNEEILLADNPKEFARKIAALMNDPCLWTKLSVNGRGFVENRFSWARVAQEYLAHFKLC